MPKFGANQVDSDSRKYFSSLIHTSPAGVRLSTSGASSGFLHVYDSYRNHWGVVCGAQWWGKRHQTAACEAAGYGPSSSLLKRLFVRRPVSQMTNYRCLFSARRGTDCSRVEWKRSSCSDPSKRLYLSCQRRKILFSARKAFLIQDTMSSLLP